MLNLLFGLNGRIDRLPYFLLATSAYVVMSIATTLFAGLWVADSRGLAWLTLAAIPVGLWVLFAATWKRLQDFEIGGQWALLMFVPVVNVGMYLIFSFLKGDIADPPFHAPPPPPE